MSGVPAVHFDLEPFVSLSTHQAQIQFVRQLRIDNPTARDIRGVEVRLITDPEFAAPQTWRVSRVASGGSHDVDDPYVRLRGGYLASVRDTLQADVVMQLVADGSSIGSLSQRVDVLAPSHWGGFRTHPELLAGFCQPNDPAVPRILRRAADILRDEGRKPSFSGYDADTPDRVREMANGIWSAVASVGIEYAYPEVTFDGHGQRIRSPSVLVTDRLGTCLDLSMLFCAALEQAYLHPVVVLEKKHAYVGVHLSDGDAEARLPVQRDSSVLKRMVRQDTVLLFETTMVTKEPKPFRSAVAAARRSALRCFRNGFDCLVDIRAIRTRKRVAPLPLQHGIGAGGVEHPAGAPGRGASDPTNSPGPGGRSGGLGSPGPKVVLDGRPVAVSPNGVDRLERWRTKLLDLSPKNPLIARPTGRVVPIDMPDPALGLHQLATRPAKILAVDQESAGKDEEPQALQSPLGRVELNRRLGWILQRDGTAREEGGASILFLAFGALEWRRSGDQDPVASPVLLLPVSLHRDSYVAAWRIRHSDGHALLNPALGAALEREYGVHRARWDEIVPPQAAADVDFDALRDLVAEHVAGIPGNKLVDDVFLGAFSFRKLFMWRDLLESAGMLVENRTVRHLADTPTKPYVWGGRIPSPGELDDLADTRPLLMPLNADSTQLTAVVASRNDADFVLVGPPGTGKSQTIANIIAQGMADGKTILFAAQKAVALDVVRARLKELDLHRFCLQIRPGRRERADVVRQLRDSWTDAVEERERSGFVPRDRIEELQRELNQYPEAIHEAHPNGRTVHWALSAFADSSDLPQLDFHWSAPGIHGEEEWGRMASLADALGDMAQEELRDPVPGLMLVAKSEWSSGWQAELLEAARELLNASRGLDASATILLDLLGATGTRLTGRFLSRLTEVARSVRQASSLNLQFARLPEAPVIIEAAGEAVRLCGEIDELKSRLSTEYRGDVLLDVDLQGILELAESDASTDREAARAAWSDGAKPVGPFGLPHDVEIWIEINRARHGIRDCARNLRHFPAWRGTGSGDELKHVGELVSVAATLIDATAWCESGIGSLTSPDEPLLAACEDHESAFRSWEEAASRFERLADRRLASLPARFRELGNLASLLEDLAEHRHRVQRWCAWNRKRDQAKSLGIDSLASALIDLAVPPEQARRAFEGNYARWWLNALADDHPVMRRFTGVDRDNGIRELRRLVERGRDGVPRQIRCRLRKNVPSHTRTGLSEPYAALKREIAKRHRFKSIRQLLLDAEAAISELTPCMMMSPVSAARHLAPERQRFDLVILDEASQLPVSEAVGVIGRGKQTIIAGDPMQLPPSTFFEAAWTEPDDEHPDRVDLDSILEEARGASLPEIHLNWHYRSKSESLIHFSNSRYYDGRLVTLPTATTGNTAVEHVRVQGDYQRGSGLNRAEASALVRELLKSLKEDQAASPPSIGVVTLNQAQRDLVESLLQQERQSHPTLDAQFRRAADGLFVKNIENAQGDERDLVFFSVTYGPDADGRLPLTFGPLGIEGGERRLNVAITRARERLVVLSSFEPEEISATDQTGQGVRDLAAFLDYARGGTGAPKRVHEVADGSIASPFEVTVARAIEDMGWNTHLHVGEVRLRRTSHTVDIGVVDPRDCSQYLAGVECDGDTYASYDTAADRDILRPDLLRARGWNLIRVWSRDYHAAPDATIRRVAEALDRLRPRVKL